MMNQRHEPALWLVAVFVGLGIARALATLSGGPDGAVTSYDDFHTAGQVCAESLPAISYAGTNIAWDCDDGNVQSVTITNDCQLGEPANIHPGTTYMLMVTQDGAGSHGMTYHAAFLWGAGTVPTNTAAAASLDLFTFVATATNMLCGQHTPDMK